MIVASQYCCSDYNYHLVDNTDSQTTSIIISLNYSYFVALNMATVIESFLTRLFFSIKNRHGSNHELKFYHFFPLTFFGFLAIIYSAIFVQPWNFFTFDLSVTGQETTSHLNNHFSATLAPNQQHSPSFPLSGSRPWSLAWEALCRLHTFKGIGDCPYWWSLGY